MTPIAHDIRAGCGLLVALDDTAGSFEYLVGDPSTMEVPATTTATSIACPTGAPQFEAPDIQAALEAAPLPPGVAILQEIDQYNVDDESMINVLVYVCQPGLKGDQLKDVATILAQSLKASSASAKIQEMVSNRADRETDQTAKVRCEDFQSRTFSTGADPGALRASRRQWRGVGSTPWRE